MGKPRNPNGRSSIYCGGDGDWHGRVTVGVRDDGSIDRRHVRGKTKADVIKKVRQLERDRDSGRIAKPGKTWTVAAWLTHWLDNIVAPVVRDSTLSAYRVAANKHLVPAIGRYQLDKLTPEHLERLYRNMISTGSAPATAHQAHRTIRAALNEAVRRGHIHQNPARLARGPRLVETEIQPYTIEEVQRLLDAATDRPNAARWAIALALGLRQGEALGLQWSDIDLNAGTLTVRRSLNRPQWRHGCTTPCGHRQGSFCPQRVMARPISAETKSAAGRRMIGLPAALVTLLNQHHSEQAERRATAGKSLARLRLGVHRTHRRAGETLHGLPRMETPA